MNQSVNESMMNLTPYFRTLLAGMMIISGCLSLVSAEPGLQSKPFTFVQMCDTQLGMGGYAHDVSTFKQAVKQINALKPDFTVICGDLIHKPNDKSFEDFNKIKSGFTVRCYCAAGNHDVGNKPTAASLKRYREKIGKDYYAIEHKDYTFVITNTQLWKAPLEGESEKHHAWVIETLKKAKKKGSPVFIVAHYPVYTKDPDEKDNYYNLPRGVRKELLALYKECGVIAVLAGHTHKTLINNYQGIQLVNGETTSKNFDKGALGFRLWSVASPTSVKHAFVPLDMKAIHP
jgi:predicted phosphodiesterase